MNRLNLTLDDDTYQRLEKHAKQCHSRRATLARVLLRDALAQREARARARQLAADYRAGAREGRAIAAELESGQLELLGEEDE